MKKRLTMKELKEMDWQEALKILNGDSEYMISWGIANELVAFIQEIQNLQNEHNEDYKHLKEEIETKDRKIKELKEDNRRLNRKIDNVREEVGVACYE